MDISSVNIKKAVVNFLHRFHVMVFVVVVLGGMIAATLVLNSIISKSTESADYSPPVNASFDQKTIERVKELKTRNESNDSGLDLPSGRTNPFVE